MSRSYKKTPRAGDQKDKTFKRLANRRLRYKPVEESYPHKTYRKTFCSYEIADYQEVGTTFEQFYTSRVRSWHRWHGKDEPVPTKEQCRKDYEKWYKRK